MMEAPRSDASTSDRFFWAGVVALAVFVRVWGLGTYPLGAAEAEVASRAWQALGGHNPDPGLGGWLTPWVAVVFFFAAPTAFWARWISALVGGLLPLLARAWQPIGGRGWARALAVGWALDPALIAASRLAWGPAVGIGLVGAAWTAYRRGYGAWALLLALVALATGPAAGWALLVLLAVAFWEPRPRTWRLSDVGGALVVAGLLLTTVGLAYPAGLGGWAGGLVAWWHGWWAHDGVPAEAAAFYLGPILLWALWGAYRARLQHDLPLAGVTLSAAALVAGLWLVYPARQAADLAWITFVLWPWVAAAWAEARWEHWVASKGGWLLAAGWLLLAAFAFLSALAPNLGSTPSWLWIFLLALTGVTAVLIALLVAGWFGRAALRHGAALALGGITAFWFGIALSHAFPAAASHEFWQRDAVAWDVRHLEDTLTWWGNRLTRGAAQDLSGVLLVDHPSLRWLQAKSFPGLEPRLALMPGEHPWVVITKVGFNLEGTYRGQRYRLRETPRLASARAWVDWFVYRGVAEENVDYIVLWLRNDAFASPSAGAP